MHHDRFRPGTWDHKSHPSEPGASPARLCAMSAGSFGHKRPPETDDFAIFCGLSMGDVVGILGYFKSFQITKGWDINTKGCDIVGIFQFILSLRTKVYSCVL